MKIKTELIKGRDLQPGDLFSTMGSEYWDHIDQKQGLGERVYIRTNTPAASAMDGDADVYRVTVERAA